MLLVSGTNQQVGAIDGIGDTIINAGSDLTADHIIQNALIIGGTADNTGLLTIAATDADGNPLEQFSQPSRSLVAASLASHNALAVGIGSPSFQTDNAISDSNFALTPTIGSIVGDGRTVVPEPSTIVLLGVALIGLLRRGIRSSVGSGRFGVDGYWLAKSASSLSNEPVQPTVMPGLALMKASSSSRVVGP